MNCRTAQSLLPFLLLMVLAFALSQARSWAEGGDSLSSSQRELLARLASADYHTREVATERLLQNPSGSIAQLRYLYRAATVQEQQHRLMDVAYHYMMRDLAGGVAVGAGSGFIGIEMVPGIGDVGANTETVLDVVVVVRTFRGFPGHAHLRPADVILSVNDHRIDPETFTRQVGMIRPGQPVTLTVRREGRMRRVRFPIGDRAALPRLYASDGKLLKTTKDHLDRVRAVVTGQAPLETLAATEAGDVPNSNTVPDRMHISVPVRD